MKVNIGSYASDGSGRPVKVQIDESDTWNMDHTLALIIVPMLEQLKETTHGAPNVSDDDVPEELKRTPTENAWDTDKNHFKRWDWVLNEMIWAFKQIVTDDEEQFFKTVGKFETKELPNGNLEIISTGLELDKPGYDAYHSRISRGTQFFGKYYRNLWT